MPPTPACTPHTARVQPTRQQHAPRTHLYLMGSTPTCQLRLRPALPRNGATTPSVALDVSRLAPALPQHHCSRAPPQHPPSWTWLRCHYGTRLTSCPLLCWARLVMRVCVPDDAQQPPQICQTSFVQKFRTRQLPYLGSSSPAPFKLPVGVCTVSASLKSVPTLSSAMLERGPKAPVSTLGRGPALFMVL